MISGGDDGSVKFWNPDSGQFILEKMHANTVTAVVTAVTSRADLVLTAGFDGCICVFDVRKRRQLGGVGSMLEYKFDVEHEEEMFTNKAGDVCVTNRVGGGVGEGLDTHTHRNTHTNTNTNKPQTFESLRHGCSLNPEILCLHYHEETGLLVSGGNDLKLRSWNLETYQLNSVWHSAHSEPVTAITGDASYLFSGSSDGTIGGE